jgi:hypothetical protein
MTTEPFDIIKDFEQRIARCSQKTNRCRDILSRILPENMTVGPISIGFCFPITFSSPNARISSISISVNPVGISLDCPFVFEVLLLKNGNIVYDAELGYASHQNPWFCSLFCLEEEIMRLGNPSSSN